MASLKVRGSLLCATALMGVLAAGDAQAGGFAIREQSTTGLGAAFAGVAAGGSGSISGMFWNSAVVTQSSSWQSESHAALILPQSDITIDAARSANPGSAVPPFTGFGVIGATSGDIGQDALVPASYHGVQVTDQFYLGLGINAPFGLVTDAPDAWAGRFHAQTSDVFTLNANPVVGYKINDMISVGVGLQVEYIDARLTSAIAGAPPQRTAVLEGDDIAIGATAGVTITPMPGTTIGLGYRSQIDHDLEGTATNVAALGDSRGVSGTLTTPDTVTLGIRHDVSPDWTLMGGVEWSNWSNFQELRFNFAGIATPSVTLENWDDGWFFSLGAEYHYSDATTFRFGGAYEISPVPDAYRTPRIPDADRIWASVGLSHQINGWMSVDAAYTHIFVDDAPISLSAADNPTRGALVGNSDGSVDIVGLSVKFNWGSEDAPRLFGN